VTISLALPRLVPLNTQTINEDFRSFCSLPCLRGRAGDGVFQTYAKSPCFLGLLLNLFVALVRFTLLASLSQS